ncbi:MFS transporter [Virgisporangium aliadipatigenens]|uniref:MFS transporter n=1 Tax=Virgisporangium aliadipatigenens TaxID=741659 RepID=UPI001EF1B4D8|nr:MFS transporter [Virgisporangium aliadipatigenens]
MGRFGEVLRQYNVRLWAGADLVSVTGTWMQVLGVNWYVLQVTGSSTRMGLAMLVQALPVLLLGPYGGALADRLPVRRILVVTQVLHAVLAAALALAVFADAGLWAIYAVAAVSGVVSAVDGPALGRFGGMVAGPARLGTALAFGSLIHSTGRIVGMAAGGVLVASFGPAPLFLWNAVSFAGVVVALLRVRVADLHPLAAAPREAGAVRAGFAYLLRQPVVLGTLALSFVLGSLGRNYQVTMAAMSDGPLAGGAAGYGLLSAVFAAGTVLGALVAGQRAELTTRLLVGAGLLASALQVVAAFVPGLWAFALVLVPIAAAAVLLDTTVSARVQLDTREDMRGRVLAAVGVVGSLSGMVGAPLLGWLSEVAGPRAALAIGGAVCLAACGLAGARLVRRSEPAVPAALATA